MTPESDRPRTIKNVVAGSIGNMLEWYDFAIYGLLAPVIANLFFPSEDKFASLLSTFAVFAVGYLMRPVGSLIFGYLGDRLGRKKALQLSIIMMGVPTTLLGLLPTEAQVGAAAPVLLIIVRLIQGLSVGGELTGSVSFIIEHAPQNRRAFFGSFPSSTVLLGKLVGSAFCALITFMLTKEELYSWGWRIPFISGFIITVVGLYLRKGLEESPVFTELKEKSGLSESPLIEAVKNNLKEILIVLGANIANTVNVYLTFVFIITYIADRNILKLSEGLTINTINLSILVFTVPLAGILSDRLGRKPVLIGGSLILIFFSIPLYGAMQSGIPLYFFLAQLVFGISVATMSGPANALMTEVLPTKVRMSAYSIGYNASVAIFGGTTPLIALYLIKETGKGVSPSYYLTIAAIMSLSVYLLVRETYKKKL